jgi:hypothetical protein
MAEGQELKLSDTEQASFWVPDLAKVLRTVMPIWATNFVSNNKKEIRTNEINFREVAADLRRQWTIFQQPRTSAVSKGAFPTFGSTEDTPMESPPALH